MAKVLETLGCGGGGRIGERRPSRVDGGESGRGGGASPLVRPAESPPCASPKFCSWLTFPRRLPLSTPRCPDLWGPEVPRDRPAPRSICWAVLPLPAPSEGLEEEPSGSLQAPGCCPRKSAGWCVSAESRGRRGGSCQENVSRPKAALQGLRGEELVSLCPLSPRFPLTAPGWEI